MDLNGIAPFQCDFPFESATASKVFTEGVGGQICHAQSVPNAIPFSGDVVSTKVDRILEQLLVYLTLPEDFSTRLVDLLQSCQPAEKQSVWLRGLDLVKWRECIQLFIDSGCAHEVVNCCDSEGYNAVMRAVEKNKVDVLCKLLTIDNIDLNTPFPSFDGDTPLIRSVKSGYTDAFNLLLEHPHVDIHGCDGDGYTARANANSLENKFMARKLLTREVQVAYLRYMED